jgi:predicted nucleic acid-binding protein
MKLPRRIDAPSKVLERLRPLGLDATTRGEEVLRRVEIVRISDRVLRRAGALEIPELRSLDAIHLATAQLIEPQLKYLVTYDERVTNAAAVRRIRVGAPA